ncbi:Kinesin-like protein KIF26A, partial [Eschrichtius robustus]|nr:Kinesin-like protein KIF26A [Eschrichtius robustus]
MTAGGAGQLSRAPRASLSSPDDYFLLGVCRRHRSGLISSYGRCSGRHARWPGAVDVRTRRVQVSVAPAGLGGALSTVTIQAQQCLEGMWSVSRVNSFLPPTCLGSPPQAHQIVTHSSGMSSVEPALGTRGAGDAADLGWFVEEDLEQRVPSLPQGLGQRRLGLDREDGGLPGGGAARCFEWEAEAAVAAVAVADTVRDGPPSAGPDGASKTWSRGGACTTALVTPAPGTPAGASTGPSAAASFFLRPRNVSPGAQATEREVWRRAEAQSQSGCCPEAHGAAQKLSLASKRKKPHPPPAPAARGASTYPTDFSGVLQLWPPPVPPCLLRTTSKAKDNPSSVGKLQDQSELRAPTAEKAAFYLDAALAARSTSRAGGGEDALGSSHMLFTLHVYQYRVEKEHRLTMLLRETLATANCRTTMIAHVSDEPARHAETLSTVQLAAHLHRLRRKKVKGPRDADHFRCSTFAELQERLECIHGSEGPQGGLGGTSGAQASPARGGRKPSLPEAAAPRKAVGSPLAASTPRGSPGPDTHRGAPEPSKAGGDQREDGSARPELPVPDKATGGRGRRPLPSLAPPLPRQLEAGGAAEEPGGADGVGVVRTPPVGRSGQEGCPRPSARGRHLERGLLTTTVTLQQPVELNGEDELVPDPSGPDSPVGPDPLGSPTLDGPLEDGSFQFSERDRPDSPGPAQRPCPTEEATAAASRPGREPHAASPRGAAPAQTIHSSLPRKPRTTSAASRVGCPRLAPGPPGPGGLFEDPWLLRADECGPLPLASASRGPSLAPMLACARRVVDGCEVGRAAHRPEAVAQIPPLRRGATTLGVTTPSTSFGDASAEAAVCPGSPKAASSSKKSVASKGDLCPRPGGVAPPAPPVRKSSLEHKNSPAPAPPQAGSLAWAGAAAFLRGEGEARPGGRADHSIPRATSSLKARAGKAEAGCRPATHGSLERCEGLAHGSSKAREGPGRPARAVPRLGVPPASPTPGPAPACRSSPAKGVGAPKPPTSGGKGRSPAAGGSRALGASVKPLAPAAGRTPGGPVTGPRVALRAVPCVGAKASRGTIMGTKQALRAAHSRVNELAAGGGHGRSGPLWGSADSDSGNDSGVNVSEERPPVGPVLPSPYSKVTAPRRPQRYSSGHGSDNSSVLSGELPPAMGRTALFYHSGGSSGYESMMRDSEATGSASSAPDSMSDSGAASPGARSRSLKSPKKRATGLQRRRLIPAPLPDAAALGRKPSLPGQWVDLPLPLAGSLKEPFEIKVYEIDDVERLQRHRLPPGEDPAEPSQNAEKGPVCVSAKLRLAERRQQRLQEVWAKHETLREELAETQGRLMVEPGRWLEQFEVDPELEPESAEYLAALERATAALEQCVNLCKARVMMVTCFDISAATTAPGPQEVDV